MPDRRRRSPAHEQLIDRRAGHRESQVARETKFARWSGTGAVAVSSGEGDAQPVHHRLDTGGNRRVDSAPYIISVTQQRAHADAQAYLARKAAEARPDEKPAARTSSTPHPTTGSAGDKVNLGGVTLRHGSRLHHIGVGCPHNGTRVLILARARHHADQVNTLRSRSYRFSWHKPGANHPYGVMWRPSGR